MRRTQRFGGERPAQLRGGQQVTGASSATIAAPDAQPTPLVGLGRVTPLALGPVLTSPPRGWLGRGSGRVDWAQVALFRAEASERLSAALAHDPGLDRDGQRELGRSIILELLQAEAAAGLSAGRRAGAAGCAAGDGVGGVRRLVRAGPAAAAGRRRPGREHHHHRPRHTSGSS